LFDIAVLFESKHDDQRILYIQFADPAAYPPIEHSANILASSGWDVVMLGTQAFSKNAFSLELHPNTRVKNLPSRGHPGAEYAAFCMWCLYWVLKWRPKWIYGSDPLALPALWAIQKLTGVNLIYHEHDTPPSNWARSAFTRFALSCRERIAREAQLCIFPQQKRLEEFIQSTGRKKGSLCVWNCPSRAEIRPKAKKNQSFLSVYYHGSINDARVPRELVSAASRLRGQVRIRIAGYETPGSEGYVKELTKLAAALGAPGIVESLGTVSLRSDLLELASQSDVGLALMPLDSDDINLQHMVGASNKPFDYMARGLPLLVSDLPEWHSTFVEPGYARCCNPRNVDSIEAELRWFLDHEELRLEMGRRGTRKIEQSWNYETVFAGVLEILSISTAPSVTLPLKARERC
jgi:glycosyltransferase involved in cell wall biosynthesis